MSSDGSHDARSKGRTPEPTASGVPPHAPGSSATPSAARLHLWQVQGVRDALLVFVLCAIVYLGYWLRDVTVPLLIALTLAYLFEPLVQRLCRFRGITRPGAVLIILLTVGVTVTVAIMFTVPLAIGQTVRLVHQMRSGSFNSLALRAIEYAPEQYRDELRTAADWLHKQIDSGDEQRGSNDSSVTRDATRDGSAAPAKPPANPSKEPASTPESAPPILAPAPSATTPSADAAPPDPEASDADPDAGASEEVVATESLQAAGELLANAAETERLRSIVREELSLLGVDSAGSRSGGGSTMTSRVLGMLGPTAHSVLDLLVGFIQFSLIAFLIPFYFYFFSVSFPQVLAFGRSLIPERNRERSLELITAMDRAVSGFVRGRIVICAIMGLLFAFGWLICGVPYAVTIGLFVGAVSLVPYLGGIGLPLAVGFLLFDQLQHPAETRMAWWGILLWPSLVFIVVQTLESYLLTPMIAGKATDLDPVTIVVAILAGGSVAGVYGMLLAIPAAACGKILLKEVFMPRLRAWSRGEASDPLPLETLPPPES